MTFEQLGLIAPIRSAAAALNYAQPTPIQTLAIPPVLAGRDIIGCAKTGTGKTAAFAMPILQLLAEKKPAPGFRPIRALVLTPTRELAIQVGESFEQYGAQLPLRATVVYGGVGQAPQAEALSAGVDILTATPGRLLDLQSQGLLRLSDVEIFVLDEADRMLDMGFIHDMRKVVALMGARRQTLLFSATMPPEIERLAGDILKNPMRVSADPPDTAVHAIQQSLYYVDKPNKSKLLIHLLEDPAMASVLVFARTRHGADKVTRDLTRAGIVTRAIHSDKSQSARQRALNELKSGTLRVLVATDIAARGIDVTELSHVVNYQLSEVAQTHIHRIGRTGRAGQPGAAISFCDAAEKPLLRAIEALMDANIPVVSGHPFPMTETEAPKPPAAANPFPSPRANGRFRGANTARKPGRMPSGSVRGREPRT